jgi:hypothetical protein
MGGQLCYVAFKILHLLQISVQCFAPDALSVYIHSTDIVSEICY